MPTLDQHPVSQRTKLLLVGDSGLGKTALLSSLVKAGYKLYILDFDNGLDILADFLTPEEIKTVVYESLSEDNEEGSAFGRGMKIIYEEWPGIGSVKDFGENDVLVIDSLTFMSEAAKRVALSKGGKKRDDNLSQADWGFAQRLVSNMLSYVTSSALKCNVVVTSHMYMLEEDGTNLTKAYPHSCGRGLSTIVGRFFNNVYRLDVRTVGGATTRKLRTVSDNRMALKNTAPSTVLADEEPDLATIFKKIQGNALEKGE